MRFAFGRLRGHEELPERKVLSSGLIPDGMHLDQDLSDARLRTVQLNKTIFFVVTVSAILDSFSFHVIPLCLKGISRLGNSPD